MALATLFRIKGRLPLNYPLERVEIPSDRPAERIELLEEVLGVGAGDTQLPRGEADRLREAGDRPSLGRGGGDLEADRARGDLELGFLEDLGDGASSCDLGEVGESSVLGSDVALDGFPRDDEGASQAGGTLVFLAELVHQGKGAAGAELEEAREVLAVEEGSRDFLEVLRDLGESREPEGPFGPPSAFLLFPRGLGRIRHAESLLYLCARSRTKPNFSSVP
jgi:hypothetical protein